MICAKALAFALISDHSHRNFHHAGAHATSRVTTRSAAQTASHDGSPPGSRSAQGGASASDLATLKLEEEPAFPGGYDASKYASLSVDPSLKELFSYIGRYKPEKRQLPCELKPFIPDYIAAVGDVDEFLKPPRPDGKFEPLGLKVLDEPSMNQSDPAIMRKFLRAHMKGTAGIEDEDEDAIQHGDEDRDAKIDQWIKDVDRLRETEVAGEVRTQIQRSIERSAWRRRRVGWSSVEHKLANYVRK